MAIFRPFITAFLNTLNSRFSRILPIRVKGGALSAEDLNLEFEEDTEVSDKPNEGVDVDATLAFSTDSLQEEPSEAEEASPQEVESDIKVTAINIADYESNETPQVSTVAPVQSTLPDDFLDKLEEIFVRLNKLEESKSATTTDLSELKSLDQKVTQLLVSIHKKAPAVKAEVQMIKKLMTDFLAKSGK